MDRIRRVGVRWVLAGALVLISSACSGQETAGPYPPGGSPVYTVRPGRISEQLATATTIPAPFDVTGMWEVLRYDERPGAPFSCFRNDGAVEFKADGQWTGYQRDEHTYHGTYGFLGPATIRMISGVTYVYTIAVRDDVMTLSVADLLTITLQRRRG